MRKLIAAISIIIFMSIPSFALSDGKKIDMEPRDQLYEWIKNNVIGKTVVKEKQISRIANDTIETIHAWKGVYGNLVKTSLGLYFNIVWSAEQINYDLDENQKRIGEPRIKNRSGAARYEFIIMESTGEVIGISRALVNTITDATAIVTRLRPRFESEKLIIDTYFVDYTDYFDKGGTYKPGGSEGTIEMWSEDGKLHFRSKGKGYNLDPKTLEKLSVSSTWETLAIEP